MLQWLSVNTGHTAKYSSSKIREAGFNGVHPVLQVSTEHEMKSYAARCRNDGVGFHGRIAKESLWLPNGQRYMSAAEGAQYYAETWCRDNSLASLSVLNEADGDPEVNVESWCLSPAEADVYLAAFYD